MGRSYIRFFGGSRAKGTVNIVGEPAQRMEASDLRRAQLFRKAFFSSPHILRGGTVL
jgi:hypothetical protein